MSQKPANTNKKRWFTGFGVFLLFILAFSLVFRSSFQTVQVTGNSMFNTFKDKQRLLCSSAYWLVGKIRPNDVVVFKLKPDGEHIIKRVYKIEGDEVDWLNVPEGWDIAKGAYKVPPGGLYVLGDNRAESEDSRAFGPIKMDQIVGKVILAN